jgi:hypothetical protein
MDPKKAETRALSDDELDAVSGGETQAEANAQREEQNRQAAMANQTFAQALAAIK